MVSHANPHCFMLSYLKGEKNLILGWITKKKMLEAPNVGGFFFFAPYRLIVFLFDTVHILDTSFSHIL